MPVTADLREAPVGLLQRDLALHGRDVVDEPEDRGQPGVVGAAAAYGTARRHRVLDQRRLVRDRQQREGDGRLAAVEPVAAGHREHRRLDVLGPLAAGEQQLPDTQGQVEYARHRGARVVVPLDGFRSRAVGDRHPQHRAHPVLPRSLLGQPDHRDAVRGREGGRGVPGVVGARRGEGGADRVRTGSGTRSRARRRPRRLGCQTRRKGELRRRMIVVRRRGRPLDPGGLGEGAARLVGLGLLVIGTARFRHHSTSILIGCASSAALLPSMAAPMGGHANGRHTPEGVPPEACSEPQAERQCAPPCASRRL